MFIAVVCVWDKKAFVFTGLAVLIPFVVPDSEPPLAKGSTLTPFPSKFFPIILKNVAVPLGPVVFAKSIAMSLEVLRLCVVGVACLLVIVAMWLNCFCMDVKRWIIVVSPIRVIVSATAFV